MNSLIVTAVYGEARTDVGICSTKDHNMRNLVRRHHQKPFSCHPSPIFSLSKIVPSKVHWKDD